MKLKNLILYFEWLPKDTNQHKVDSNNFDLIEQSGIDCIYYNIDKSLIITIK